MFSLSQVADILVKKEEAPHERVSTESVNVLSGKKVYVGIDVHKEGWHVTVRTDGEEGRMNCSQSLKSFSLSELLTTEIELTTIAMAP